METENNEFTACSHVNQWVVQGSHFAPLLASYKCIQRESLSEPKQYSRTVEDSEMNWCLKISESVCS